MTVASRKDCRTQPLPEIRVNLEFKREFSMEEIEKVKKGFIPQSQDDKWFIFLENEVLFFCRSWTGSCIYWLKLGASESNVHVVDSYVNRDKKQYTTTNLEYDRRNLSFLIDLYLLKKLWR